MPASQTSSPLFIVSDHVDQPSPNPPTEPPAPAPAASEGGGAGPQPASPPPPRKRGRPKGVKNGAGRRPRARALRDQEIKEFRETVALAMAVGGKRSEEIAEALGISLRLAQEILQDAKRSEIFQRARDFIGQQLLPKVLANLEELLNNGDKEVTLKMADSLALIGSGGARHIAPWGAPPAPQPTPLGEVETFEAIRLKVTRTQPAICEGSPAVRDARPAIDVIATPVTPALGPGTGEVGVDEAGIRDSGGDGTAK